MLKIFLNNVVIRVCVAFSIILCCLFLSSCSSNQSSVSNSVEIVEDINVPSELVDINIDKVREISLPLDNIFNCITLPDNSIINYAKFDGKSKLRLNCFDQNGNQIYQKDYNEVHSEIIAYCFTRDNGMVFVAPTQYDTTYYYENDIKTPMYTPSAGMIIRLDNNGDILWSLPLTLNVEQVESLVELPNKEIITVGSFQTQSVPDQTLIKGWKNIDTSSNPPRLFTLMRIKDGILINRNISNDFSPNNMLVHGLDIVATDNGIAVAPKYVINTIYMYNFDFELMWSKTHNGYAGRTGRLYSYQNEIYHLGTDLSIFYSNGNSTIIPLGLTHVNFYDMAANGTVFYTEGSSNRVKLYMVTKNKISCIDFIDNNLERINHFFATDDNGCFVEFVCIDKEDPTKKQHLATKYDASGNIEFRKKYNYYIKALKSGIIVK